MKKITLTFITVFTAITLVAQVPQAFKYQAVVRDSSQSIISDQLVSLKIGIVQDSINGTVIYSETHTRTTNQYGLISLEIGNGTVTSGVFDEINWGHGQFYMEIWLDENGGSDFLEMGTIQLLSVPYAFNSKSLTLISPNGTIYNVTVDDAGNLTTQCPSSITDCNGNNYDVILIGSQCWMSENLVTSRFNDGSEIPLEIHSAIWSTLTSPGYCWYNNDSATFGSTYGAMYNWYAVNAGNLCPKGWHIPTDEDWSTLITYAGGESVAGGNLKEADTTHWKSPNIGATNEFGFTALPGGGRSGTGSFYGEGVRGNYWSATDFDATNAWYRALYYDYTIVYRTNNDMKNGFSIRCIRD